jgi:hypothetical protein
MTFKIGNRAKRGSYPVAIDDETGIEVFEKYYKERNECLQHDAAIRVTLTRRAHTK